MGNRHYLLTGCYSNAIQATNFNTIIGFRPLAIEPGMQPSILSSLPTNARKAARHRPLSRCSLLHHTFRNRAFLRWRNGLPLIISCKNSKNSGSHSERGLVRHFYLTAAPHSNFNLKEKFCCRFAAGATIGNSRYNHLLHRWQPRASTGWPSIAVAIMLFRYWSRRRAAA